VIRFQHVSKRFGGQVVLDDVNFQVNPGEHVGVVGPNGAGKSTVFNLIVGEASSDKGDVILPARGRLGYVHQQLNAYTVDTTLLAYTENAMPDLQAMQEEIHTIEAELHRLSAGPDETTSSAALLRRLGELQTQFEHMGGYTIKNRAEQTLSGLGFPVDWFHQPFRALSGGWQSRAELARVLVARPDVLLLDEPSNYLDIPAVEWLQQYLLEYKGTLMLVSHDRFLLNSLTDVTLEIANTKAERYKGNYDTYAQDRVRRYDTRLAEQKNQDRKREQLERFVERFRAKNTRATQVQSRIKQMEKMLDINVPQRIRSPGRIRLRPPPHCGAEIVRLENAGLTYDGNRWVLRGLDFSVGRGEKLALVGFNGLGKTTLLRMLAGNLEVSEGRRVLGHKVIIGYQSQDFAETMDPIATVFGTIRSVAGNCSEQEIRTLLGGFGFPGEAIEKTVSVLSGGEKIRLAFARLLVNPPNFLVLDEPTTHLDIQAREALEKALQDYEGTICLVSHDIDFVRSVATGIVAMTPPGVARYSGGYDYYHQKMTEQAGAQQRADEQSRRNDKTRASETGAAPATRDRKALRKERALAREAVSQQTRELKKEISRIEKQIEIYTAERDKLVEQMAGDPARTDFAVINKRAKFIQEEIERYTRRWELAATELEGLTTRPAPQTETE